MTDERATASVADSPVIPALGIDGITTIMSLKELLKRSPQLRDLASLSPPEYSAWRRVLAALTYRVSGLDDVTLDVHAWRKKRDELWLAGQFSADQIDAYFAIHSDRWLLFSGPRPWLQVPELRAEADRKDIAELLPERPSGTNTATLFSPFHDGVSHPVPVWVALAAMLRSYGYAGGGRMGNRTLPNSRPNGSGYGAPLRAKVSHFPVADTLFHTLVASLVPPRSCRLLRDESDGSDDLAEWEAPASDPTGPRPTPRGIISLLTNNSQHAILLDPDDDGLVSGAWRTWRYAQKAESEAEGHDPFLAYRAETLPKGAGTRSVARYSMLSEPPKDSWRDLASLVPPHDADQRFAPPEVLREVRTIDNGRAHGTMRVAVASWHQEPGQQRDGDWNLSLTPDIHVALWNESTHDSPEPEAWRRGIDHWVRLAHDEASELRSALRRARCEAFNLGREDKAADLWAAAAETEFWTGAHRAFNEALSGAEGAQAYEVRASGAADVDGSAHHFLHSLVEELYDTVTTPHITARSARAIVSHRPRRSRHLTPKESS